MQDFYTAFLTLKMSEIEANLLHATEKNERAFWRALLDLRLQMAQEQVLQQAWSEEVQE